MANKSQTNESASVTETAPTPAKSKVDWDIVGAFVGEVAGEEFTLSETSTEAAVYFVSMGISQSFVDVKSGKAGFVGVTVDGKTPKNPWTAENRIKEAKRLEVNGYNDDDMAQRESLATLYFTEKEKAKFSRIVSGELVHGGGRGSRIDAETKLRHEVTEVWFAAQKDDKANWEALGKAWDGFTKRPEHEGVADAQVRRLFLDLLYQKKPTVTAWVDAEIAARKKRLEDAATATPIDLADL